MAAAVQPPAADLDVLIEQLQRVIANPEAVSAAGSQRQQILQLTRTAAVAIEEPFETVQRLAYSVSCRLSSTFVQHPWSTRNSSHRSLA